MVTSTKDIALFWMRRDLRLSDNYALYMALRENEKVLPVFIFDRNILDKLSNKHDARISFLYGEILKIKEKLMESGSDVRVYYGYPFEIFRDILLKLPVSSVYLNHDYEPYAIKRDQKIKSLLGDHNIQYKSFKDQVIFEKNEILNNNKTPYKVFTPYMRKWKTTLTKNRLQNYNPSKYWKNFIKTGPTPMIDMEETGFKKSNWSIPSREIDEERIRKYDQTRNYPGINGTSRLGIHLRFGTISIRQLVNISAGLNEIFLNELIWRDFYMMILWNFPHVVENSFKKKYDSIQWKYDENLFKKWCDGNTGVPIVDAGMRELNQTGYMHNRVRMITASFLTKNLLIDWRLGEAYFADKLLDFELSSNNGGWQWAAGTGADAAPYFRIFNPYSQADTYDPEQMYIKKWVPEYKSGSYPKPIIDLKSSRERAIKTYKKALDNSN